MPVSTGILASSNFFMQALVAPTREEANRAHSMGEWVEIGVQSIRNFRFISRRKIVFWVLFSITSIPLHLVFNGCVLESKATTSFKLLMVSESFLKGAPYTVPALTEVMPNRDYIRDRDYYQSVNETISHIYWSYRSDTGNWERLDYLNCMSRYNDVGVAMVGNRHVIMVVSNNNEETSDTVWSPKQVNKNLTGFDDVDLANSLWCEATYQRTGGRTGNELISEQKSGNFGVGYSQVYSEPEYYSGNTLDVATGELKMKGTHSAFRSMQIDYCLSEKFSAPCRLSIANSLLLVVCIMCVVKCLLCIITLKMRIWGDEDPLMTPGDAISSFITNPESDTKGICTLSYWDFDEHKTFSPGGQCGNYTKLTGPRLWTSDPKRRPSKAIPRQIWYLSYIIIEGSLFIAGVCLAVAIAEMPMYVFIYYYSAEWPYNPTANRGLQYSTIAILIGFSVSLFLAFSPAALAMFRLPGRMVLGGSNSKVISAACHCIPVAYAGEIPESRMATVQLLKDAERDVDVLDEMATRRLRWGQVSSGRNDGEAGHLTFGVEEQEITEPIDGKLYSG
ncbi:hypothetical protein ACHAPT_012680 [Fusarium lateritium]